MGLQKILDKFVCKYRKDIGGQFAVITALIGLPLLLASATAIDISRAHSQNSNVSSAIDAAALAAVIPNNMSQAERYAFAQSVFDKNYLGRDAVSLQVSGNRERVDIVAISQVPTTISGMLGIDYVSVQDKTAAVVTRSDVVCVLALDPVGERAIEFKDKAVFNAPACSVQVNSVNANAMESSLSVPPTAKSFCVAGISIGQYNPLVKHSCTPVADPYAGLKAPVDGNCISPKLVAGYLGLFKAGNTTADTFGTNAVMIPGTYCKGLKIDGVNVTFLPGTYIIKNKPLEFSKDSQVNGDNVTFVLKDKASLELKGQAQVKLKAPSIGPYAGLVFFQTPPLPTVGKAPSYPTGVSNIKSGGGLNIIGTAYFPTQQLIITSESPVQSQSPATSFIAYRMEFGGRSNTQIHVDHEAGGVPPLLPRSDVGARLVR